MKDIRSIIYLGPLSGHITGQRISFEAVSIGKKNTLNLLSFIDIFKSWLFSLNCTCLYYTGSRSYLGFIRDLLFIIPFVVLKRRIINHLHGDDFNFYITSNTFFKKVALGIFSKMDCIVASEQQRTIVSPFFNKVYVVHNFSRFNIQKVNRQELRTFLYISTVNKSKGIFVWLELALSLFEIDRNLKFQIVGSCNFENSDDELVFYRVLNEYNVMGMNIEYMGELNELDLLLLLKSSTDLIYTSCHPTENRPLVLLEAASIGLRVHCTVHRGLDKVFPLKLNSINFNKFDSISIAKKILNFELSSEDLLENDKTLESTYSIENHRDNINKIINFN